MEVEGSLVITQVDEDDDAKYQCLAKNVVGTRGSEKAQLSVLGNDSFNLWLSNDCKSVKSRSYYFLNKIHEWIYLKIKVIYIIFPLTYLVNKSDMTVFFGGNRI